MRRLVLFAVTLSMSAALPAAAQSVPPDGVRLPLLTAAERWLAAPPAPWTVSLPAAEVQSTQRVPSPPQPPPPEEDVPRRRGSMVGYLDDPIVSSKIRIRFDVARSISVPDRAEFFYAKCGCYRDLVGDPAFDPDARGPGPGIVTDLGFQQLYVQGEYAATRWVSFFAEVPFRQLRPESFVPGTGSFGDQDGLSDVRAGVKLALVDTVEQMLSAQVRVFLPTGDGLEGLGTEHATVEPALLYYQRLSERASLEAQFGVWLPLDGSPGVPASSADDFSGRVLTYGVGPSVDVYRSGTFRFAPVVELVGWRVLGGFQTTTPATAEGVNIVNLKVGARASWANGASLYAGYGRALTDSDWYDDIFRVEYRFAF